VGPRPTHATGPGAQHQNYSEKQQSMNFHESTVDAHLGGAEYRGGIHLVQLAMVGEKIAI